MAWTSRSRYLDCRLRAPAAAALAHRGPAAARGGGRRAVARRAAAIAAAGRRGGGMARAGAPAALLSRYIPAMCNRYESPEVKEIERFWHVGARQSAAVAARHLPARAWALHPPPARRRRLRARAGGGAVGPDPLVRQGAEAQVPDEQRPQRGAGGEGQLQGPVEAGPALHHPGHELRRAVLGAVRAAVPKVRVVALPPRRRRALGPGRPLERLDRQGHRRRARELHHADAQRGRASAHGPHAQARGGPEDEAGAAARAAGQALGHPDRGRPTSTSGWRAPSSRRSCCSSSRRPRSSTPARRRRIRREQPKPKPERAQPKEPPAAEEPTLF